MSSSFTAAAIMASSRAERSAYLKTWIEVYADVEKPLQCSLVIRAVGVLCAAYLLPYRVSVGAAGSRASTSNTSNTPFLLTAISTPTLS